jgi:hypothetical protein
MSQTFEEYVLETTCREVAALSFEQQLQIRALFDKQRGNKFNYTYLSQSFHSTQFCILFSSAYHIFTQMAREIGCLQKDVTNIVITECFTNYLLYSEPSLKLERFSFGKRICSRNPWL